MKEYWKIYIYIYIKVYIFTLEKKKKAAPSKAVTRYMKCYLKILELRFLYKLYVVH